MYAVCERRGGRGGDCKAWQGLTSSVFLLVASVMTHRNVTMATCSTCAQSEDVPHTLFLIKIPSTYLRVGVFEILCVCVCVCVWLFGSGVIPGQSNPIVSCTFQCLLTCAAMLNRYCCRVHLPILSLWHPLPPLPRPPRPPLLQRQLRRHLVYVLTSWKIQQSLFIPW